eukprot:scaffold135858_cov16-Tisochrysis_lutea.AAC.3
MVASSLGTAQIYNMQDSGSQSQWVGVHQRLNIMFFTWKTSSGSFGKLLLLLMHVLDILKCSGKKGKVGRQDLAACPCGNVWDTKRYKHSKGCGIRAGFGK